MFWPGGSIPPSPNPITQKKTLMEKIYNIMTIYSDATIIRQIRLGNITIDPIPENIQIQPSSVDLRLGNTFKTFKPTEEPIDPTKDYIDLEEEMITIIQNPYTIQPGEFILGHTLETITLPDDITARIEGKSTLGRLGLTMHVTAGYIDPGFNGQITLEICNLGPRPVTLYTGMRVCQIVFEDMTTPSENPYNTRGRYMNQRGPVASKFGDKL